MPKITVAVVSSVLLVLSNALAGCVALPGVSCSFSVHNPHQSSGSPAYMLGKAEVSCSGTVQSLTGEIRLERKNGTTWAVVYGSVNDRTINNPTPNKKYTIQTGSTYCANGVYRTAARGSGIKDGVNSGSVAWQYSQEAAITCK